MEMSLVREGRGGGRSFEHLLLMAFSFRITPLVQEIFYNRCTYVSLKTATIVSTKYIDLARAKSEAAINKFVI